jgi:hypothetical protein
MKKLLVILMCLPTLCLGQMSKRDSLWSQMSYFIGKWQGEGSGEPGTGKYQREYQWVMNKRFIQVSNKSTYPPAASNNNKGETHEDMGFISYNSAAKRFMLRQFHTEGFVNQYKLDSISPDKKTIVFITEAIENIPAGYRARESYTIVDKDNFIETFEIAEPGKDFALYTKTKLKRQ